jgi:hypothetical protein
MRTGEENKKSYMFNLDYVEVQYFNIRYFYLPTETGFMACEIFTVDIFCDALGVDYTCVLDVQS